MPEILDIIGQPSDQPRPLVHNMGGAAKVVPENRIFVLRLGIVGLAADPRPALWSLRRSGWSVSRS
jgi:hypothetical protein